MARPVSIRITDDQAVSGLLLSPPTARAALVLAHGAGAGMTHPFMAAVADGLAARNVASLRYQFPFMEAGSRRPDRPVQAMAAVHAAVDTAARLLPHCALFAGGKSFGGRMTSTAQATAALPAVRGLVFLGFPLHPAGKPAADRADHLAAVKVPMLFVQGTRDALATLPLMTTVVERLGECARLRIIDGADHGFHVPVRSGRRDEAVLAGVLDDIAAWTAERLAAPPRA